jgi:hypothetical protein
LEADRRSAADWIAHWCEALDAQVNGSSIEHFIEAVLRGEPPPEAAVRAAAALLIGLGEGVRNGEDLNQVMREATGWRTPSRAARLDTDSVTIDSREFAIVLGYVEGRFAREEAIRELLVLHPGSEAEAGQWIDAIKPRAEQFAYLYRNFSD